MNIVTRISNNGVITFFISMVTEELFNLAIRSSQLRNRKELRLSFRFLDLLA
ncbi:13623_t:CDS:2 [Funneliformis mosseae]|uniref:13623_t:CDS:1 n=1 Tax=Funneliformis mosseae TaxID=27381 RepID=A0A9N8VLP1_FUNMO|nr:13623_t:CDS:2 [Funneliformis mosseae]